MRRFGIKMSSSLLATAATRSSPTTTQLFLDRLDESNRQSCGVYLFERFIPQSEATELYTILNDDKQFPWDIKPKLYGESMTQHAYLYVRPTMRTKQRGKGSLGRGIETLENLCSKIEKEFDGKITEVFCNRFQDPTHHVDWHTDTYGRHIFVLSLGSERRIEFREKRKKKAMDNNVASLSPKSGDLYFMPLSINSTHQHRVCSLDETRKKENYFISNEVNDDNQCSSEWDKTRLSFVFFFESPKYARAYRISMSDRIKGYWETLLS